MGCNFQNCRKDKGFNFKIRLKEEGFLPAIAVGLNDIGGTGLYSSEYIVGSYGINKLDMHFGLGWGTLNGTSDFRNPFTFLSDSFEDRPGILNIEGGKITSDSIFSGKNVFTFYGISYAIHPKVLLKSNTIQHLLQGLSFHLMILKAESLSDLIIYIMIILTLVFPLKRKIYFIKIFYETRSRG